MVEGKKQTIPLPSKQYIFFDLDGTILNSEPLHMMAIKLLLQELNPKETITTDSLYEKFHGQDDLAVYTALKESFHYFALDLDTFLVKKNNIYIKLLQDIDTLSLEKLITPGFRRFIKKMYRKKRTLGLVSASEKDVVYSTIKRLNIENLFSVIEYRKPGTQSKPAPDPYLQAMKKVGATPENTLIFEDSQTGLKAALSSKASVCQIHHFTERTIQTVAVKNFNSRKLH